MKTYKRPNERPLSKIKVKPLIFDKKVPYMYTIEKALGLSWNVTFPRQITIAFWSGFIQLVVNGTEFEESEISILNFVNFKPSDPSTLYTALRYTQDICDRHEIKFCPVTFDQPLFIKAVEILEQHKSELKSNIIRIGSFHNLMSFMGAIGTIMADYGLTDLLETVSAPNTAAQMETGHDYARALRANILSAAAVTKHMLDVPSEADKINCDELAVRINKLIYDRENGNEDQEWRHFSEIPFVKITVEELCKILQVDESDCQTVKLWKQYLENISTLRMLLFAEHTGNHDLHVHCVK